MNHLILAFVFVLFSCSSVPEKDRHAFVREIRTTIPVSSDTEAEELIRDRNFYLKDLYRNTHCSRHITIGPVEEDADGNHYYVADIFMNSNGDEGCGPQFRPGWVLLYHCENENKIHRRRILTPRMKRSAEIGCS